jgi:hypothetical protein
VSAAPKRTRVGSLRPSALIHTFGIGSVVDLPHLSSVILGLDSWSLQHAPIIDEPRLLATVRAEPGLEGVERLHGPPQTEDLENLSFGMLDASRLVGVPIAVFPRWLLCPVCRKLAPLESGLFELRTNPFRPDRNCYIHRNCQAARRSSPTVLPARFVVACEDGHLDDFPWVAFVHRKLAGKDVGCAWSLRLDEIGASGEVADIQVRCTTCDSARRLSEAFGERNRQNMPLCSGGHPHLRERFACERTMRPMLLGASNSWFPVGRSALSLPRQADPLAQLVEEHWGVLERVTSPEVLAAFRGIRQLDALGGVGDADLLAAIDARRAESREEEPGDLKLAEWAVLTGDVLPQASQLTARAARAPSGWEALVERVVLVERLREVQALLGFTRIESPYDEDGAEHRVRLSRQAPQFLPAAEVHGEGIFLQLREQAVVQWGHRNAEHAEAFLRAHSAWRARRNIPDPMAGFPGLRYVLLHSLSHALMRRMALDCGYNQASIRERIYSQGPEHEAGAMAGVLLYTAAPDSEGTLGGLVALGEPAELGYHLQEALADAGLCASDPLCAEHAPDTGGATLHAAACHACLFAPETSCERGNRYLDRATLAGLITGSEIGYFPSVPR